ncbi:MAG TPA: hypothetical protein VKR78_00875 [Acidimicrobiales bacterium]|jgi:hypothetical protein|nr:hypothetical protein [Acidimicrobiales bacterium]
MDAEAYADMLPWLVFLVINRKSGLGVAWAGGAGLTCSAGLVAWSYWRGRPALLPLAGVFIFAELLVSGILSPTWNQLVAVPRAVTVASLCALALGSLAFTPLSEAYTVPLVAPAIRDDPRFRKVNVDITLAWGIGAFLVAVASGTTELVPGPVARTFFDWVTPLVLAAGTMLWGSRRWELFRLAVDAVPIGSGASEAAVPARRAVGDLDTLAPRFYALRPVPDEPTEPAKGAGEESRDGVIRSLPLRRRRG